MTTHSDRWLRILRPGPLPVLLALALGPVTAAESPAVPPSRLPPLQGQVGRLVQSTLSGDALAADLRYLCDRIGGRPTGSRAMQRAIEWAVQAFRDAGAQRVATEVFDMPLRWEEGASTATVVSPEAFPINVASLSWSPPTPPAGLERPLLAVGRGNVADFQAVSSRVKGKILLVFQDEMRTLEDLIEEYVGNVAVLRRAAALGASAVLFSSTRPRGLLYRHQLTFDGPAPLPAALVAREDALRLLRLAENDPVRMVLRLPNRIGEAFTSRNVVAEITGREWPEQVVLLGAHLDSWDMGTGALDNGASAAALIEVARAFASSGVRPRRTIRLVLFSGEEQGLIGSRAYVRAHRHDLDALSAVVIFDTGVARIRGYFLGGRPELEAPLRRALSPIAGWGVGDHPPVAFSGTDHFDFLLEGIPALVAHQETTGYLPDYHAASDTLDKIDLDELRVQAAIAAATAYGIAELDSPLGPRLPAAGIARIVRDAGLRRQMEAASIWDDYVNGRRGRRPPAGVFQEGATAITASP